jgi:hypothetical protein
MRPRKYQSAEEAAVAKRERERKRHAANREAIAARKAEYYKQNAERIKTRSQEYEANNRAKVNERKRKYQKRRRMANPAYAVATRLRGRFNKALHRRRFSKTSLVHQMVGCDWETLKNHIESQFKEGMAWERFREIHIDHIIPLKTAATESEMANLFHYTNLRPLWAAENLKKGSKVEL